MTAESGSGPDATAGALTQHDRSASNLEEVAVTIAAPGLEQVRQFIHASKAPNTLRGYKSDWRHFCAWCETHALTPIPALPETVAAYIADCAGFLKVGSIQRRLNAVAEAHKAVSLESPTRAAVVANTLKGIRRTKGTAPSQKIASLD